MFRMLWTEIDWRQRHIVLFGSKVPQPRLTAWCSDPNACYSYSGVSLKPRPWHPLLAELRDRLREKLDRPFNSVLLNAYRDGNDSMGWHADNEAELGPHPVIASISLGAMRHMLVRPAGGGPSKRLDLADGSLLVMRGNSQAAFRHCIPKVRRVVGSRINLTFRVITSAER